MPRSRTGGYLAPSSDLSACHAYSGVPIPQSTCPNLVWSYHNVPAKIVLFVAGQQGAVLSRSEWSPTWRERSKVISADPHWPAASPLCPALGSTICLRSFPHPCLPSSFQSPGALATTIGPTCPLSVCLATRSPSMWLSLAIQGHAVSAPLPACLPDAIKSIASMASEADHPPALVHVLHAQSLRLRLRRHGRLPRHPAPWGRCRPQQMPLTKPARLEMQNWA